MQEQSHRNSPPQISSISEGRPLLEPNLWVEQYGDYLYAYAFSRLRDKEKARDIVQETFLAALKAQETFLGNSTEKTWLVGILKHKIIDTFRHSARYNVPLEEESFHFENDGFFSDNGGQTGGWRKGMLPAGWYENPVDMLEQKEFRLILERCLNELPSRTAHVFTLREIDGVESKEICAILEITENNLWALLFRARQQLRRCLELLWFAR